MSRTRERLPGASTPVLSAAVLAQVSGLNFDYLELLVAERRTHDVAAQLQFLPSRVALQIAALPLESRRRIANAPFTLYSLGLEDDGFWRAACEPTDLDMSARYAASSGVWLQAPFSEVALLHAWHLANANPLAAKMVYAMSETTAARLAATPPWQIRRIAQEHPALLTPRWPTNPAFWPDLAWFAAANDAARLVTAQLLGCQLIAAELDCAAACEGAASAFRAASRSPRLRARKLRVEARLR